MSASQVSSSSAEQAVTATDRRRVILVPHSHWDREWYEPFEVFRAQLVEMLDGVLSQMATEPGFTHFHLDGQSILIDDYLEIRPEREPEVAELIRSGRWSIGPMYTLADEFLVSGEGLIRNFEYGLERAASFGVHTPVDGPWAAYLPDQFGHIGQLPQILQLFDIDHAVVLRGVTSAIGRSAFRWRAPDGSQVRTEYMIHGYYVGADIYPEDHIQSSVVTAIGRAVDKVASVSDRETLFVPVGADHSRPTPGMFDAAIAAAPRTGHDVEVGSLARFLSLVHASETAPVITGELRAASTWVLLPNTVATRTHLKRRRGELELRLERYAEPLATLISGLQWPDEQLDRAWRLMLQNAEHDAAYGASHDQVARDVDERYDEVEQIVDEIISDASRRLALLADRSGVLCWNPSPFEREGVPSLSWCVRDESERRSVDDRPDLVVDGPKLIADGSLVLSFSDEADSGDLFTFCPDPEVPDIPPELVVCDDGTAVVTFSSCSIRLCFEHGPSGSVGVHGVLHNHGENHRVRMWVDTLEPADGSTALSVFELVDRPHQGEGFESEIGSVTWPASGGVLVGGTAVLGRGVFEYEVAEQAVAVTLLRAVGQIGKPSLATRPIWAGPPVAAPEGQCLGDWEFSFGVAHGVDRAQLVELWEQFALPLLEVPTLGPGSSAGGTLIDVSGAHLSSIRRRGDQIEVGLWNDAAHCVDAVVGRVEVELGPHQIRRVKIDRV